MEFKRGGINLKDKTVLKEVLERVLLEYQEEFYEEERTIVI